MIMETDCVWACDRSDVVRTDARPRSVSGRTSDTISTGMNAATANSALVMECSPRQAEIQRAYNSVAHIGRVDQQSHYRYVAQIASTQRPSGLPVCLL